MALAAVNNVSYTGTPSVVIDHDKDGRVRAGEVGVATGATLGSARYGYNLLNRVKKVTKCKDPVKMSAATAQKIKDIANADKQVISLWKKMGMNAAKFKEAIIAFAQKTATGKLATKVVKSKAFGKFSAVLGGVGAVFVFISGIGEMSNTFGKMLNKPDIAYDA